MQHIFYTAQLPLKEECYVNINVISHICNVYNGLKTHNW